MKKTWIMPQLTVHGTIEDITMGSRPRIKDFGPGDDFASNIRTLPNDTPLS